MTSPRRQKKMTRLSETAILSRFLRELEALLAGFDDAALRSQRVEGLVAFAERLQSTGRALPVGLEGFRERILVAASPRELMAFLVPVERALERRVRDEDLLPVTDRIHGPRHVMPVSVIVDSFRSAFNVGGVFRTAECFGVRKIVLTGYAPLPSDPRCARTAMGTETAIPWREIERIGDAVSEQRERGVSIIALETGVGIPSLNAVELPFPSALVLGNERFGLPPSVVESADLRVCIPMYGRKNSLNVVNACGIALYELRTRYDRSREDAPTSAEGISAADLEDDLDG